MKTYIVNANKGGVAKTTTVTNLAAGLSFLGKKVLIIDLDIQGQVTLFLGASAEYDIYDVVMGDTTFDEAIIEARDELFVLPGGSSLAALKNAISQQELAREKFLVKALLPSIKEHNFDYVFIDTAPALDILNYCGLFLADELIIPVLAEPASVHSFAVYMEKIKEFRDDHHPINISYVIPTAVDHRYKVTKELMLELQEFCGDRLTSPIRTSSKFKEAVSTGQTILEYAPNDARVRDYEKIVFQILEDSDE